MNSKKDLAKLNMLGYKAKETSFGVIGFKMVDDYHFDVFIKTPKEKIVLSNVDRLDVCNYVDLNTAEAKAAEDSGDPFPERFLGIVLIFGVVRDSEYFNAVYKKISGSSSQDYKEYTVEHISVRI